MRGGSECHLKICANSSVRRMPSEHSRRNAGCHNARGQITDYHAARSHLSACSDRDRPDHLGADVEYDSVTDRRRTRAARVVADHDTWGQRYGTSKACTLVEQNAADPMTDPKAGTDRSSERNFDATTKNQTTIQPTCVLPN